MGFWVLGFGVLGFRFWGSKLLGFLDVLEGDFLDVARRVSEMVCSKPSLSLISRILLLVREGSICLRDFGQGNNRLTTFCKLRYVQAAPPLADRITGALLSLEGLNSGTADQIGGLTASASCC